jgi:uncharacterized protein
MKYLLTVLLSAITLISFAQTSADSTELKKDIKRLLVLTEVSKAAKTSLNQMFEIFKNKPEYGSVSNDFFAKFSAEIDFDEFEDMFIPIYAKHLSHAVVKDLIVFYQTPSGKTLTEKLPLIMTDSMILGSEWGQKIAEKIIKKLDEKKN